MREDPVIPDAFKRMILWFFLYDAEKQSAAVDMELGFDLDEYKRCVIETLTVEP